MRTSKDRTREHRHKKHFVYENALHFEFLFEKGSKEKQGRASGEGKQKTWNQQKDDGKGDGDFDPEAQSPFPCTGY